MTDPSSHTVLRSPVPSRSRSRRQRPTGGHTSLQVLHPSGPAHRKCSVNSVLAMGANALDDNAVSRLRTQGMIAVCVSALLAGCGGGGGYNNNNTPPPASQN